jgi:hypothetical protein
VTGLLVYVGGFALVAVIVRQRVRARRARLAAMALQLGLTCTYHDWLGAPMGTPPRAGRRSGAKSRPGGLQALGGLFFPGSWEMAGHVNGRDVRIGQAPGRELRRVQARFRTSLNLGLRIASQQALDRLGRLVGQQDLSCGDAGIDARLVIQGRSVDDVAALVGRRPVHDALRQVADLDPTVVVDDEGVSVFRTQAALSDADAVRSMLDRLTRTADALEAALASGDA